MNSENSVFAIYSKAEQVEGAVDELVGNGFAKAEISVLYPKNKNTREFAGRKGTHPPHGTDKGRYANLPLNGRTWGSWLSRDGSWILKPGEGHELGALHDALIDLGVPEEWCRGRVVHGKTLVSVLCERREEFFAAIGILTFTGASDISWSVPPEKYWER